MFNQKKWKFYLMAGVLGMTTGGCNSKPAMEPPVAKKLSHDTRLHGDLLKDDYFWLREKSNSDVKAYLEAENAYADSVMAPTRDFQEKLYQEMLSHIKETDVRVPYQQGPYFYYSRTEQGKQYPIHCRKKEKLEAPEEVILDLNELARNEKFMSVGVMEVSNNAQLLAYSTDHTGFRQYRLQIKDLNSGKVFPEVMQKVGSVAWAADNQTLFYTVEDAAKRQYRLYRHLLGSDPAQDSLVFEEKDDRFEVSVDRARSQQYLFLVVHSHTTSECRFLPANRPSGEWKLIAPRVQDQEYYADHHGDYFYLRTNRGGRNFEVVTTPVKTPDRPQWKPLIAHRADLMLEGHDLFANYLVLWERQKGLQQVRVRDLKTHQERQVAFPDAAFSVFPGANRQWETTRLRYHYQSPITPESVFDYDMVAGNSTLLKQQEVPGGFDRNHYNVVRAWVAARDRVQVPVTIFYKKGVPQDGTAPLYLYGYGSYGYSTPASFSSSRLSLLNRGVVMALAHIRGGGELGKPWHDDGRMGKKMNTFTDFVDVAEWLVSQKYGSREKIAIEGGSAGGLLMGAVTNLRPDLWKAVISHVPFVDVINTMMDATLPLTVGEYEEWGNPNKAEEYAWIKAYSPYDNLKAGAYPPILVKTSFNDSQVMYWEPAKYVARLRTLKQDQTPLLLKTNMAAGHGGSSGRYDHLREIAFDYAFILTQLGMDQ